MLSTYNENMNELAKVVATDVANTPTKGRIALSAAEFQGLADMPPELEWFASIESANTRRAYELDIRDFMAVKGVKRPKVDTYEGKTPALGDHQARELLEAPDTSKLKGVRDRAILSVFLFHALRREELTKLRIKDFNLQRSGVPHIRVQGKGGKTRYLPTNPATQMHVAEYLERAGHGEDKDGPLFRPVKTTRGGSLEAALTSQGVYENVVKKYMRQVGLMGELFAPHALRATAATNALTHDADIAKVQEWLGHANIQTTRIYDRRKTRPEDSPTFRVRY